MLSEETVGHMLVQRIDGRWQITEMRFAQTDKDILRAIHYTDAKT